MQLLSVTLLLIIEFLNKFLKLFSKHVDNIRALRLSKDKHLGAVFKKIRNSSTSYV